MACKELLVGWLTVFVPPDVEIGRGVTASAMPSTLIPGLTVTRFSLEATDRGGRRAFVRVHDGTPHPGEPMEAASRVPVDTRDGPLDLILTRLFFGAERAVTVAYPKRPGAKGPGYVFAEGTAEADQRLVAALLGGAECRAP